MVSFSTHVARLIIFSGLPSFAKAASAGQPKTAMLLVGVDPFQSLGADAIFKERLEAHDFTVVVTRDKDVTLNDCEEADAVLISASIGGGNVGHRLDNCTTPQLIWEVGIYQFYGMSGPTNSDAWVTSKWWNTYHQDAWKDGAWPPAPTGKDVHIALSGFTSPLAGGALPGRVEFFTDPTYGMNWVYVDRLGPGAEVIGLLPHHEGLPYPERQKAVLFVYRKGAELYGGRGPSPSLRIAFPPYGFGYGADPTCEELKSVPACKVCESRCKTADQLEASGVSMMPLTDQAVKMLDAGIVMLAGEITV